MRHLAAVVLAFAAACGGEGVVPDAGSPDASPTPEPTRVGVFGEPTDQLDILFVVDNSSAMSEAQAALSDGFYRLLQHLDAFEGGRPDLHIGVISSDVGAGTYVVPNCEENGDDGALQATARNAVCTAPTGSYLVDVDNGSGGRAINYESTLDNAFTCIAELGSSGCGFEQHLESLRRALDGSQPFNDGFLRPFAALLVVILADEDDCSVLDTAMFDPSQDSVSDPLGAMSSFRCFEFGVECATGNDTPRAAGPRTDCGARADSPYMPGADEFVDFVRGLKTDPTMIMVTTITGDPTPVAVEIDAEAPPNPRLTPSCRSNIAGIADPAVRLSQFARAFPARHLVTSICGDVANEISDRIGQLAQHFSNGRCLVGDLAADAATLNATCTVADVTDLDGPAEARTPLPTCASAGFTPPCWTITTVPFCTLNPAGAVLTLDRGNTPAPAGSHVVVDCPTP